MPAIDSSDSPATIQTARVAALAASYRAAAPALRDLDAARYRDIPAAVAARAKSRGQGQAGFIKPELLALVDWKLRHGTFRPTLRRLVESNTDADVESATARGLALYGKAAPLPPRATGPHAHVEAAMAALTQLKGVGPATASLLLSVHDPEKAPFFADELFLYLFTGTASKQGSTLKPKYNAKEYLDLVNRVEQLLGRLNRNVPEADAVTASDLEKAAYVLSGNAKFESEAASGHDGDAPPDKAEPIPKGKRKASTTQEQKTSRRKR